MIGHKPTNQFYPMPMYTRYSIVAAALLLPLAVFFALPTTGCNNAQEQTASNAATDSTPSTSLDNITPASHAVDTSPTDSTENDPAPATEQQTSGADTTAKTQVPTTAQDAPDTKARPSTEVCGTITDEMIHQGAVLFSGKGNCSTCHKGDATGTPLGPDLTDNTWLQISGDYPSIIKNIKEGVQLPVEYPTPMPAMGGAKLTDQQICELAAYVWSLRE